MTVMIKIKGGNFLQGWDDSNNNFTFDNEKPSHIRNVSDFKISKYPITNHQYMKFILDDGYFKKEYWTNYNIIEAASWIAKAIIIIPGLIFGIQIWQFYFIALFTSLSLIWASNKKLLPTLVGFNTLWIWLSMMVIAQNIL